MRDIGKREQQVFVRLVHHQPWPQPPYKCAGYGDSQSCWTLVSAVLVCKHQEACSREPSSQSKVVLLTVIG